MAQKALPPKGTEQISPMQGGPVWRTIAEETDELLKDV